MSNEDLENKSVLTQYIKFSSRHLENLEVILYFNFHEKTPGHQIELFSFLHIVEICA